ncbi:MAG: serine hydrolase domain-containing protein [Saprospiraceae bacterium]
MRSLLFQLVLANCLLFSLASCGDEEIEINNDSDFEEFLADEMDAQNIPAMSVLIFKDDSVLHEEYLGQSNIEQEAALKSNDLFLMASVSKVVTATALLQLHEDGLFELDDNINDYLSFDVNVPNQSTSITFRMLLTHTSGIADGSALDDQYYYGEDSPVALSDFLENYLAPGGDFYNATDNFHAFAPGSQHEYSNVGNALIGVLVEQISGLGFNAYCKQNIFSPLGMTNTFWRLDEISGTIVTPYNYANRSYEAIDQYTFTDYPNGGLRSTASDMLKFFSAFTQGGQSNNVELLSSETVDEMLTPQIPAIDSEVGLHLFVMDAQNSLWGHDGGEQGVATIVGFNLDTKVGAIVLTNQGDAELEEVLAEAYKFGLTL